MRRKYYSDGVTRVSAPFYVCECEAGHKCWSVTGKKICSCGKPVKCRPANQTGME